MRGAVALGLVALALGACGSGAPKADAGADGARDALVGDGGADALGDARADGPDAPSDTADAAPPPFDAVTWDTRPSAPQAFDVTAALALTAPPGQEAAWASFPRTARITLVWKPDTGLLLLSSGAATSVSTDDQTTFHAGGTLAVTVPDAPACMGQGAIYLTDLAFSVDGVGALRGTTSVRFFFRLGDQDLFANGTATLTGVPDTTSPSITMPTGLVDPMEPLTFELSEVVSPLAKAALVGQIVGDVVPLDPELTADDTAIYRFTKPDVMLRPGQDYRLEVTGAVDFAANTLALPAPATFGTPAAAPLSPEDGFESAAGPTFGGAAVLAGPPLAPLFGAKSLILNTGVGGGFGFLPYDLGPSLAVRLSLAPTDTVVRFESRLVAADEVMSAVFNGYVRIATVGQGIVSSSNIGGGNFARVTLPQDGDVWESDVSTYEIHLPADATGDVTFEIAGITTGCGVPPPSTALIIDNLRAE